MNLTNSDTFPALPDYRLRIPVLLWIIPIAGVAAVIPSVQLLLLSSASGTLLEVITALAVLSVAAASMLFGALLMGVTNTRLRRRARQRMLDLVPWRGDEQILDIGCGNGYILLEAAKRAASATGLDRWDGKGGGQTKDRVRRNAQLEGVADRVTLCNADALYLPFPEHSFDIVFSSLAFHHIGHGKADREMALIEAVRVLKPAGLLVIYDMRPILSHLVHVLGAHATVGPISVDSGFLAIMWAKKET